MPAIVEYRFNTAATGTGDTNVADTSGNNRHATANFATSAGSWATRTQGRYLSASAASHSSAVNARVAMNVAGLGAAIEGRQQFSIIVSPVAMGEANWPDSPLVSIGEAGQPEDMRIFNNESGGARMLGFRWGGGEALWYGGAADPADQDRGFVIVVDSTQATAANRVRVYRKLADGENVALSAIPIYTAPTLNAAFTGVNDANTFLTFLNNANLNDNFLAGMGFFRMENTLFSQAEAFAILDNLATNDDADPFAPPALAWTAEPLLDQATATGMRLRFTANKACTARIVVTAAGSSQPSDATFNASGLGGAVTAFTPFTQNLASLDDDTDYRVWVRIADGTTTLYDSDDESTLELSDAIISVNGGQPIREGQIGVVVDRQGGADGTDETIWNGVVQANHTVINPQRSTFDVVWPNLKYGETGEIEIGAETFESPPFQPPADAFYVDLDPGYSEANPGATPADPDLEGGVDQLAVLVEGGTVELDPFGRLKFKGAFDGTVTIWSVDGTDRSRSANATRYYAGVANTVPAAPVLDDVSGAQINTRSIRNWVLAGLGTGVTVDVVATGAAQVSLDGVTWHNSVQASNGTTVQVGVMSSGLYSTPVTGGAAANGAGDSFTVTTRAANAPTVTTQPVNSNPVTAGVNAVFTAAFTGAASIQWYNAANNSPISGATAATLSFPTNSGHAGQTLQFYARATSAEGGTVQTNTVSVSVIAAATRLVIPAGLQTGRGQNLAGQQVTINVRADVSGKAGAIVYTTTLPIAASGPTNIDNNQNGNIGTARWIGLTSSVDNTEALYPATVVSAA